MCALQCLTALQVEDCQFQVLWDCIEATINITTTVYIEIFATHSHWQKFNHANFLSLHRGYGDLYCIDENSFHELFLQCKGSWAWQKFYPAKFFMYTVSHSVQMIMHRIECLMFTEYLPMLPVQPAYQATPSHLHLKKGNRQHHYVHSKSG